MSIGKNEEYCKTIVMLRNKYCVLEENLAEVKIGLLEKEKENGRLRERIVSIEGQKGK